MTQSSETESWLIGCRRSGKRTMTTIRTTGILSLSSQMSPARHRQHTANRYWMSQLGGRKEKKLVFPDVVQKTLHVRPLWSKTGKKLTVMGDKRKKGKYTELVDLCKQVTDHYFDVPNFLPHQVM